RLASQVHRLRRRHDAELFAVGADQSHRADADLLVDPVGVAVTLRHLSWVAIVGTRDTLILLHRCPQDWPVWPSTLASEAHFEVDQAVPGARLRVFGPASAVPAVRE